MNTTSLIEKTLSNKPLSKNEILYLVNGYTQENISDDQMTLWLKAVFKHGLSSSETQAYTKALLHSGKILDFSYLPGYVIDKHSTGGVGDKVSLILGPILAACGCYVPMVAGRGLAHTGGTIDKLETIPNYESKLSLKEFCTIVENIGISIIRQTSEICPADGKIYALRDVTQTVASFPLICGSIMSKKIAEGLNGLVLDIKMGNGAFMENQTDAFKLGDLLVSTGEAHGLSVYPAITSMNEPLGKYSGNWCEIKESIASLQGNGPTDTMEVVYHLGEKALSLANIECPREKIEKVIDSGHAYEIFEKLVHAHNGDTATLRNPQLHQPKNEINIKADKSGYISNFHTQNIGWCIVDMGGGRRHLSDNIDPTSGITCHAKLEQYVQCGDPIFTAYCASSSKLDRIIERLSKSVEISEEPPKLSPRILR